MKKKMCALYETVKSKEKINFEEKFHFTDGHSRLDY